MSEETQNQRPMTRKRPSESVENQSDKRLKPESPLVRQPQIYVPPSREQVLKIAARFNDPAYRGLSLDVLRQQPHPITKRAPDQSQTATGCVVKGQLLECSKTSMLDATQHKHHRDIDAAIRRAMLVIITIRHQVPDDLIAEHCIPSEYIIGSAKSVTRNKVLRDFQTVQRKTGKWFKDLVKSVRALYNGEEFDHGCKERRTAIWVHIWDEAPYETAKGMLCQCASVVDLENIFYNEDQDTIRETWQALFKSEFVFGCERMVQYCPGPFDANLGQDMLSWYTDWRNLPNQSEWREMSNLWRLDNLPVQDYPLDRAKRLETTDALQTGSSLEDLITLKK